MGWRPAQSRATGHFPTFLVFPQLRSAGAKPRSSARLRLGGVSLFQLHLAFSILSQPHLADSFRSFMTNPGKTTKHASHSLPRVCDQTDSRCKPSQCELANFKLTCIHENSTPRLSKQACTFQKMFFWSFERNNITSR